MSKPVVSIVVPSYNHARYIPMCVDTVLAQTMPDWEMIVVDDISKDNSMEVWKSYDDPRIKVYQNETNLGTYGNENKGVSLASADLIAIMNSDDFWEPTKLEKQVALLESHPKAGLCYTLGWRALEGDLYQKKNDNHVEWPRTEVQELFPYFLTQNNLLASSVIFRKEWARFDESLRYSGDWIAAMKAAFHHAVLCVPEHLTYWRIHPENMSQVRSGVTLEDIRIRREFLRQSNRWFNSTRWSDQQVRETLGWTAMHLSAQYVLYNRMDLARQTMRYALKYHHNKKHAIRRYLGYFLPYEKVLSHIWPGVTKPLDSAILESIAPFDLDF